MLRENTMFIVIGERINTTLGKVKEAVEKRDAEYIKRDVKKQTECGATYIDVNAGASIVPIKLFRPIHPVMQAVEPAR